MNKSHDDESDEKTSSLLAHRYSALIWRELVPIGLEIILVPSNVQIFNAAISSNRTTTKGLARPDIVASVPRGAAGYNRFKRR